MCKRESGFGFLSVIAIGLFVSPTIHAQYAPPPQAYTVVETNSMFGPAVTMQIYRDGSRALVDTSHAAQPGGQPSHLRTLYDLGTHQNYTWDLLNSDVPCGAGTFSGDWGDPFAMSSEMNGDLAKQQGKPAGTATLNGVATKIFEASMPDADAKVWVEQRYGLIMKLTMGPKGTSGKTMIEVSQLTLAKPAASLFALPPACAKAAAAPRAPTEAEKITALTGEDGSNFAEAIMPPASKNSCDVQFRVVRGGSMETMGGGFKVGVDTHVDVDHPAHYVIGEGGHPMFLGGGLHEVTGEMRNGSLTIANAPPQFDMELAFGNAGFASALIYRQCFGAQTTLLLVIKNPEKISDGAEWLWVKSGKHAAGTR